MREEYDFSGGIRGKYAKRVKAGQALVVLLEPDRPAKAKKRTTHRSSTGKKLYAVRDAKGRFVDIQTYERAHRADLKRKGRTEAKSTSRHTTRKK